MNNITECSLLCLEPVWCSGDDLTAVCRHNAMDTDSCSNQTAHSHDALEKTRSTCHTLTCQTLSLTHTGRHALISRVLEPNACSQHAIRINDFQKAAETKDGKNVNTVERIRADHTTGERGRESRRSLISPDDPTLDSISADHLSWRSAQARPGSLHSTPDSIPSFRGALLSYNLYNRSENSGWVSNKVITTNGKQWEQGAFKSKATIAKWVQQRSLVTLAQIIQDCECV